MQSLINQIREIDKRQEDLDIQIAELTINQEYMACLMELNQT